MGPPVKDCKRFAQGCVKVLTRTLFSKMLTQFTKKVAGTVHPRVIARATL